VRDGATPLADLDRAHVCHPDTSIALQPQQGPRILAREIG